MKRTDYTLYLLFGLAAFVYFWNLGYNNLWTANEGFYAEAVREMYERNNFVDIYYNYEPRYNKPPLFYWLILFSSSIFGLSEFSARIPSVLCGLGSVWLTYQIGTYLKDRATGIAAAFVMFFSFQFVINARYITPAITLTYFYTLTLYWFLKAYHQGDRRYLWGAYIALGLTILTKGFPYLIVIGGIIIFYILMERQYNWKEIWKKIRWLQLPLGVLVALAIGFSWVIYMYAKDGQAFYEVYMDETIRRAFSNERTFKFRDLFFYLEANIWGFLPYSLIFYFGIIYLGIKRFKGVLAERVLMFSLAWFSVMFVVFTASKGKIPTYFIQAHPGMSLLAAYFLVHYFPKNKWEKGFWKFSLWAPVVALTLVSFILIYAYNMHFVFWVLPVLPFIGYAIGKSPYFKLRYLPYNVILVSFLLFVLNVFPEVEKYRAYDEIGRIVLEEVPDKNIPVLIEDRAIQNIPYYAERRAEFELETSDIQAQLAKGPTVALVLGENLDQYGEVEVLWKGYLYGGGSESRFLEFLIDGIKLERGMKSKFMEFVLIKKG